MLGNACIIPSTFMTRGSLLHKLTGGAHVQSLTAATEMSCWVKTWPSIHVFLQCWVYRSGEARLLQGHPVDNVVCISPSSM